MSPFIAEIIGTMLLILLGNGVVANHLLDQTKGKGGGWLLITFAWGFAVFVAVLVAGPFSGAHINPAVTVAVAITEADFTWAMAAWYILAQMIGAALGTTLVWIAYRDHYLATEDTGLKLATFSTAPAIRNPVSNVITEAIGTFVLIFAVLYIAVPEFSENAVTNGTLGLGSIGALPVAIIVIAIGMCLGGPTGYAINPARDLAPRIMHAILPIGKKGDSDWSYSWVPVLGPVLGAVIAALLFLSLQA